MPALGRALLAVLLLGAGASGAEAQGAARDLDAWYREIYEPFFREARAASGEVVWEPARSRSAARSFPRAKAPGTLRVFIIGGSVANMFDTHPADARGWTLQKVLEAAAPGRRVEVVNCGMGGYDSYREALVLREVLGYGPDAVVLMSGHNEGAPEAGPPPLLLRWRLWLARRLGWPGPRLAAAAGRPPPDPAARERAFAGRVRAMARAAGARGVALVLCTLPRHRGLAPPGPLPLDRPAFRRAWAQWERKDYPAAEASLRRHAEQEPDEPFGRLWLGRLAEARGDLAGARREYERALELSGDGVPALNRLLRAAAVEEGVALADLEAAFAAAAPGPRSDALLYDALHWDRCADPLVSVTVASALAARPGPFASAPGRLWLERQGAALKGLPPSPQERGRILRARLGLAVWRAGLSEERFDEQAIDLLELLLQDEPRSLRRLLGRPDEVRRLVEDNDWVRGRASDWGRRWSLALAHVAEALRRAGRRPEALRWLGLAQSQAPDLDLARLSRALAWQGLGDAAGRPRGAKARGEVASLNAAGMRALSAHDLDRAGRLLDRALAIDPEDISALLNRAAVFSGQGRWADALRSYDRALANRPSEPRVLSSVLSARAEVLERLGRRQEARQSLGRLRE